MNDEEVDLVFRGFLALTYEQQQDLKMMIQAYYLRNPLERKQVKATYSDLRTFLVEVCPACQQKIVKKSEDGKLTESPT